MKALADCPSNVEHAGRRTWRGTLQEPKGGVALVIGAGQPFALHLLDADRLLGNGPRCDGVLISGGGAKGLTCFLELKGAIDPEEPDRPFEQVRGAIEHFAPGAGTASAHGEGHHLAWRCGTDLPCAPHGRGRPKAITLGAEDLVHAAVVIVRGGTRHRGRWMKIAGRDVFVAVIQKHGMRGRVELRLEDIEQALP